MSYSQVNTFSPPGNPNPLAKSPYSMPPPEGYSNPYPPSQRPIQQPDYNNPYTYVPTARDEKFDPSPSKLKWNDLPFAILFWLQFGGFVAISVIALKELAGGPGQDGTGLGDNNGNTLTINL
jgi:hypothetical protein